MANERRWVQHHGVMNNAHHQAPPGSYSLRGRGRPIRTTVIHVGRLFSSNDAQILAGRSQCDGLILDLEPRFINTATSVFSTTCPEGPSPGCNLTLKTVFGRFCTASTEATIGISSLWNQMSLLVPKRSSFQNDTVLY